MAIVDLIFIYFVVPESLPERLRNDQKISWDKIDPFAVRQRSVSVPSHQNLVDLVSSKYRPRSFHLSDLFDRSSLLSTR